MRHVRWLPTKIPTKAAALDHHREFPLLDHSPLIGVTLVGYNPGDPNAPTGPQSLMDAISWDRQGQIHRNDGTIITGLSPDGYLHIGNAVIDLDDLGHYFKVDDKGWHEKALNIGVLNDLLHH